MRHNKSELFEKSKEVAGKKKLLFIQDIIDFLPISKPTFYKYFPVGSNELNDLKKIIDGNKVDIKSSLRAKWYNSDNATLQIALYRLTANQREHEMLNKKYIDHTTKGDKLTTERAAPIIFVSESKSFEEE